MKTILELQTRFTYIVNHLLGLRKTFEDDELNIKILNYLKRTWKLKITTIKESKDLPSMSMEALFKKLLACEHELIQHSHAEDTKKKKKRIPLKVSSSKDHKERSSDDEDAENLNLMVNKFGKFIKRSKEKNFSKPSKKVEHNKNSFTCFKCKKQGHIKLDCTIYLRKQLVEKKGKKDRKPKKAYIA